jgi:acyl carrier protein
MAVQTPLEAEIARLVVAAVNLESPAEEIDPEAQLYGEGLGLDSIDMLEIALAIGKQYGVELRADDEANRDIFANLRNLARHVGEHRKK